MMEVILLAGGLGTRLRDVVTDMPKPMALINGKPFLSYLLEWLSHYPVNKFIISCGYKAEYIIDYFGKYYKGIPIEFAVEKNPLGTGGAIMYAVKYSTNADILIVNGDTYFPIDISEFYNKHLKDNHLISVALKKMVNFERYGSVECQGDTIVSFNEKKICAEGLINGGIYLVNKKFLEKHQFPEVFSFEKDFLEKEAESSALKGYVFNSAFIDIGVPEDYFRSGSILLNKEVR